MTDHDPHHQIWVIQPTRALTWSQAKRWLWLLSSMPALNGVLMFVYGAPLVLPFAGLEIALLWAAFYCVIDAGRQREVVHVSSDTVTVEKGRDQPRESHVFARSWVRVELKRAPHRWYPHMLVITAHGQAVTVGDFLTEGERRTLATSLINAIAKSS